jgi:hypothetical protein
LSLAYVLGAAVMYFRWPTWDFLDNAFAGAHAWHQRKKDLAQFPRETGGMDQQSPGVGKIDIKEKTYDGFTLVVMSPRSGAVLVNMHGEVVHQWSAPFSKVWPEPDHVRRGLDDAYVVWFSAYLYPNGDLLVVYHGAGDVGNGFGLAKLDKDSNVVWKYSKKVHHDVDVGPDGTIYAVEQEMLYDKVKGLEFLPVPAMVDHLILLSGEGRLRKKIPLVEAFRDSPYAALLAPLRLPEGPGMLGRTGKDDERRRDVLHTNHVQVLTRELSPKFARLFQAGQVLVSMRHLDAIAVLDPATAKVVWAARGPWKAQHDAQFLANGRLLLFDNVGSPAGSQVLEYDPQTQAFPWVYLAPFTNTARGMCQRLPNDNTLVVNSDGSEILEITRDREVVWSCVFRGDYMNVGRRYGPDEVPFLKRVARARP